MSAGNAAPHFVPAYSLISEVENIKFKLEENPSSRAPGECQHNYS